jgi:ubiquinone/menaquinone biosynthesis C-methylase UbiE
VKNNSGWQRSYAEAPEYLRDFSKAEDPDGRVVQELLAMTDWKRKRVLEIGCGSGRFSASIAKESGAMQWLNLDRSRPLLGLAQLAGTSHLLQGDALSLPLAGNSVDVIFSAWVFSYFWGDQLSKVIQECSRVLSPGGEIWIFENEAIAIPDAMPEDGRISALKEEGFIKQSHVLTELRFLSQGQAEAVTEFLMGSGAPKPDSCGRIPHQVQLLKKSFG